MSYIVKSAEAILEMDDIELIKKQIAQVILDAVHDSSIRKEAWEFFFDDNNNPKFDNDGNKIQQTNTC